MAFDRQSLHIAVNGQLGTGGGAGEEIFTFGFRATGVAPFDAEAALAALDAQDLADLVAAYWVDTDIGMNSAATVYTLKVAAVGTNGLYLTDPKEAETGIGGTEGTFDDTRYPNQVALAVTTLTNTSIGHAVRGRFYLPIPSFAVDVPGLIPALAATNVATRSAQLLSDFNDVLTGTAGPDALMSIMSSVGAGTTKGITGVRCGRVYDTIRSRRNELAESYSATITVTT
jgi:hypothetical protein